MTARDVRPRVRVVTLNHNGGPLTLECIESLRATEWPAERLQLVMTDNASRDGIADVVRRRWPEVEVVESDRNLGFAGGSNLGMGDLDGCDYVALVNNDVTVDAGWLAPLVDTLEADPGLGAACPKILFASRYLELDVDSTTVQRGRGDARDLGVHVSGVEVDGVDVTDRVQFAEGFWGHEAPGAGTGPGEWSRGEARLLVPVARDSAAPRSVRVRVTGAAPGKATLRAGGTAVDLALDETPRWVEVEVGHAPVDLVNNAGSVLTADGFGADRGYLQPDDGRFDQPADVFAWCGAAALLSSAYLRDIGRFDERLFLYYEDLELSWRGRERGWRYRYVPESVVHHVHSATVGEGSSLARYQNERNRLLVLARHATAATTTSAAVRSLLVTASYARRDVAGPILRGDRPHPGIVRDRLRAFGGFVQLLPAMVRDRRTAGHPQTGGRATGRPGSTSR
jgi:GT2 family glycosyltransferase